MSQRTRSQLQTSADTLFAPESPKVSKSSHKAFVQDLMDSSPNVLDDAIPWLKPVAGMGNTPPDPVVAGARWLVGTTPTGAWAGHGNELATGTSGGAWTFVAVSDRSVFPHATVANTYFVREGSATTTRYLSSTQTKGVGGDASVFGNTLDAITATRMAVEKQKTYKLHASLLVQSNATTAGIHVSLGADAALDFVNWRLDTLTAAGAPAVQFANALNGGAPTDGVPAANVSYLVRIEALLKTLSTATEVYIQICSGASDKLARVMTGSTLQLTQVP